MNPHTKILRSFSFKKTQRRIDGQGVATDVIAFPCRTGGTGKLELPPSKTLRHVELAGLLADRDAQLPTDPADRKALLAALPQAPAKRTVRYAAQTGWNDERTSFVAQRFVYGKHLEDAVGVRMTRSHDEAGVLKVAGTAASWRDSVGVMAEQSTCAMFAISLSLAAPLLAFARCNAFAVNFFGPSRAGKTLCTLAAASLTGLGRLRDLTTWSTTKTGLEERLPEFRDLSLVMDDLMLIDGTPSERYQRITHDSYVLATGQAKTRTARYTVDPAASRSWRSIVMTQSERSVAEEAVALRVCRTGGSSIRLIDVPAVMKGSDVFDRLAIKEGREPAAVRQAAFESLFAACEANHGAALKQYVEHLVLLGDKLPDEVNRHVKVFTTAVAADVDTALVRDLASKCGLAYAGAMLGREAGILTWRSAATLNVIRRCYRGARDLLPDDSRLIRDGVRQLKTRILELDIRRPGDEHRIDGTRGYRFRKDGIHQCVVPIHVYNSWFSDPKQRQLVEEWLIAADRIALATPKTVRRTAARPKDQLVWADGKRRRSYSLQWPAAGRGC